MLEYGMTIVAPIMLCLKTEPCITDLNIKHIRIQNLYIRRNLFHTVKNVIKYINNIKISFKLGVEYVGSNVNILCFDMIHLIN